MELRPHSLKPLPTELLLCREKKKTSYRPAPAGSLQQVPPDWAHGDPVRAARMCVLFARINLSAVPDIGAEVSALIHSTFMLLDCAAGYLQAASASRNTLSTDFDGLRAQIVDIGEQLARGSDDPFVVSSLEQQLAAVFAALAAEEVS